MEATKPFFSSSMMAQRCLAEAESQSGFKLTPANTDDRKPVEIFLRFEL